MGKRFAIVIAVAAAGVMALGAQTAAAAVVKYDTRLQITTERGSQYHGWVKSDRDRNRGYDRAKAVWKCMEGRRVILFKQRPGADRRLATARSQIAYGQGAWAEPERIAGDHARVYAKVKPKVRDRYVCRADRSPIYGGDGRMYG